MHHVDHLFTMLDTSLSDRCCLNCNYCYNRFVMPKQYDKDRLDAIFNWFYSQYQTYYKHHPREEKSTATITFYGGEPTFEWQALTNEINKRRSETEKLGINTVFYITSNLAPLTTDRLDWLQANNVGILCSIDGCQEAEDCHRIFHNGDGASKYVFPIAKEIIRRKITASVRMTITPETVKWLFKSVVFLADELGFSGVSALPQMAGATWTEDTLAQYEEQLHQVSEWWLNKIRNNRWYVLSHLKIRLPYIWGRGKQPKDCAAGDIRIYADTCGNLWPCPRFGGGDISKEWSFGNVYEGILNLNAFEKLQNINLSNMLFKPDCLLCKERFACVGHCLGEMVAPGYVYPNNNDCRIIKAQVKEALFIHQTLLQEKNPLYLEHYYLKEPLYINGFRHRKYLEELKKAEQPATADSPEQN